MSLEELQELNVPKIPPTVRELERRVERLELMVLDLIGHLHLQKTKD
jgi:hypothetical protein